MGKIIRKILKQLFKKPYTNLFPAKYAPDSVLKLFQLLEEGKAELIPPVEVPPDYRGKLSFDSDSCIQCYQCEKVCPTQTMERDEEGDLIFYLERCTFCSQCVDMCPVDALEMSEEFLLSRPDKYNDDLILNGSESPGKVRGSS